MLFDDIENELKTTRFASAYNPDEREDLHRAIIEDSLVTIALDLLRKDLESALKHTSLPRVDEGKQATFEEYLDSLDFSGRYTGDITVPRSLSVEDFIAIFNSSFVTQYERLTEKDGE